MTYKISSITGTVETFRFTQDCGYIVAVDWTGAVMSLKILDYTKSDFKTEVNRLPFGYPAQKVESVCVCHGLHMLLV